MNREEHPMEATVCFSVPPYPYYLECGLVRYEIGDRHPNRTGIGVFDLLFVTEGTLCIGEEEHRWSLGPGEVLILRPDCTHYAWRDCDKNTVFYWLHFQAAERWTEETNDQPSAGGIRLPKYRAMPDPSRVSALFDDLIRLSRESRDVALWEKQRLFWSLLEEVSREQESGGPSSTQRLAEQVERYVKMYYRADLTNESLANALNYHPNYIIRAMKTHFGCTPMAFLMDYRLEQAKLLLIKTDWPIARIAEQAGFRLAPYFTRCFKKKTGLPPAAYRKQFTSGGR